MDLWARIKGKDYPIEAGATFNDELGETLDSGTIKLPHVTHVIDIKPYDDVIVHDYGEGNLPARPIGRMFYGSSAQSGHFYRHMLAFDISRSEVFLREDDKSTHETRKQAYNYQISLVSETKGLEKVVMPNVSILQPQGKTRFTVSDKIEQYVSLYSPSVKVLNDDGVTRSYAKKYSISQETLDFFANSPAPETVIPEPTLREALSQLMRVKDSIPVVKDGVITYLNLSKRGKTVNSRLNPTCSSRMRAMNGDSYCDKLRRTYASSISKQTTSRIVERMGFRNLGSSTMTLSGLQLNFSHPIYEIKKLVMCYYKRVRLNGDDSIVLCRQDITDFVMLNAKKVLLSEDRSDFNDYIGGSLGVRTKEGITKYKFAVIGYDIGSKTITGWGDTYSRISKPWAVSKETSRIENLVNFMDTYYPCGEDVDYLLPETLGNFPISNIMVDDTTVIAADTNTDEHAWIVNLFSGLSGRIGKAVTDFTLAMKSMFFECEYMGFVEGVAEISKDFHDGDIVHNDQVASYLTYTETDGLFEKEKANQLGNATRTMSSRIPAQTGSVLFDDDLVYPISTVDSDGEDGDDRIVYRRTMSVYKDLIMVNYSECQDYVLKNYYTSVFSKKRPYAMSAYGDDIQRNEIRTQQVLLSPSTSLNTGESDKVRYRGGKTDFMKSLISFFKATDYDQAGKKKEPGTRSSIIEYSGKEYAMDGQSYVVGHSLSFGSAMVDSSSMGVYIRKFDPNFGSDFKAYMTEMYSKTRDKDIAAYADKDNDLDNLTGCVQDRYMAVDDSSCGYAKDIRFSVGSLTERFTDCDKSSELLSDAEIKRIRNYYSGSLLKLPLINAKSAYSPTVSKAFTALPYSIHKDGKERISMTFQFEPASDSRDVQFSERMMRLSDLNGMDDKVSSESSQGRSMTLSSFTAKGYARTRPDGSSYAYGFGFKCPSIVISLPNQVQNFRRGEREIEVNKTLTYTHCALPPECDPNFDSEGYQMRSDLIGNLDATYTHDVSITVKKIIERHELSMTVSIHVSYTEYGYTFTTDASGALIVTSIMEKGSGEYNAEMTLYDTLYSTAQEYYGRPTECLDDYCAKIVKAQSESAGSFFHQKLSVSTAQRKGSRTFTACFDTIGTHRIICEDDGASHTISGSDVTPRNMFRVIAPAMGPDTQYERLAELPSDYKVQPSSSPLDEIGRTESDRGCPVLRASLHSNSNLGDNRSVRLYYLDQSGVYNFVFGANAVTQRRIVEGVAMGYDVKADVYVSLVDDRSRTVYDGSGDPTYRTANYATDFPEREYFSKDVVVTGRNLLSQSQVKYLDNELRDGDVKPGESAIYPQFERGVAANPILRVFDKEADGTVTAREEYITESEAGFAFDAYPAGSANIPSGSTFIALPASIGAPQTGVRATVYQMGGDVALILREPHPSYGDGRRYCFKKE